MSLFAGVSTLRVGLTGGIGSGKSAVADRWRLRGATIIDADLLAREVVAPGTDGFRALRARFATAVVDGALDRTALARIVFSDARALEALNAIVHPRVRARADELEADAPDGLVVHVVPLLFEGDYGRRCDATVAVIAPLEVRIARVMTRDGLSRTDVERRIAAQIDPAEARARASYVVENDGDLAVLDARADAVYDALLARTDR